MPVGRLVGSQGWGGRGPRFQGPGPETQPQQLESQRRDLARMFVECDPTAACSCVRCEKGMPLQLVWKCGECGKVDDFMHCTACNNCGLIEAGKAKFLHKKASA